MFLRWYSYLLSVCGLSLHFFFMSFDKQKHLVLPESNLSLIPFIVLLFHFSHLVFFCSGIVLRACVCVWCEVGTQFHIFRLDPQSFRYCLLQTDLLFSTA